MRPATRHHAFITLDVLGGLIIVIVLATALVIGVSHQTRALRVVRDSKAAVAIAERAIVDLQAGHKPTTEAGGKEATITVEPLHAVEAPEGWVWTRVDVRYGHGGAELTGLVPQAAAEVKR